MRRFKGATVSDTAFAVAGSTMPLQLPTLPCSHHCSSDNDNTEGQHFVWQPAQRPPLVPTRNALLTAAAALARRCADLGVQPPLPHRPPCCESNNQELQRQSAPHPSPAPEPLAELVKQWQAQNADLAGAVGRQSQQLAAQQQLLREVVQGCLLLAGSQATGQPPAATAPLPQHSNPGDPPGRQPPDAAEQQPAQAAEDCGPLPEAGMEARLRPQRRRDPSRLPAGLLKVPAIPGLANREKEEPASNPSGGGGGGQLQRRRPAWDDTPAIEAPRNEDRWEARWAAAAPRNRAVQHPAGRFAPEPWLLELRKLRRRRASFDNGSGSGRMQAGQRRQQGRGGIGKSPEHQWHFCDNDASEPRGAARAPSGSGCPTSMSPAATQSGLSRVGRDGGTGRLGTGMPGGLALEADDVEAVCERVCRELLALECAPCSLM